MALEMDTWNPKHYQQFCNERNQPANDLIKLVQPKPNMETIDLGCGTGEITKHMHHVLSAKSTLGIDASGAMLEDALGLQEAHLNFQIGKIEDFYANEQYDLIFSNAALQWIPNHPSLFQRLHKGLKDDGQLAVQVPANFDYPTHTIARDMGLEAPFNTYIPENGRPSSLPVEAYAILLYELGFREQHVGMHVYPHLLESTDSLIEWVKGTLLTYYQSHLPPELYTQFIEEYSRRILAHFGDKKPYFFPFKRILMWARK